MRVNVGCGRTPTEGWHNLDNSPSVRLAAIPIVPGLLYRLGLLAEAQWDFVQFARKHSIVFANASRRLPFGSESLDVVYSSHMFEHLAPLAAARFLQEAHRVLRKGGIIRLVVPDLRLLIERYLRDGDADRLVEGMHVCDTTVHTIAGRVVRGVIGVRHHQWMYDGASLCRLLERHRFLRPEVMTAGTTRIPAADPLDLCERADESVYVEAAKG